MTEETEIGLTPFIERVYQGKIIQNKNSAKIIFNQQNGVHEDVIEINVDKTRPVKENSQHLVFHKDIIIHVHKKKLS